jgi:hypothetical protein
MNVAALPPSRGGPIKYLTLKYETHPFPGGPFQTFVCKIFLARHPVTIQASAKIEK